MVVGLDRLKSYFEKHQDKYIIIGGTACEIRLESRGINFRGTKDIDMLLIIEALDNDFLESFWSFIRDGEYINRYIDEKERTFFRFTNPQAEDYPTIVELFSRKPDGIILPPDFHLTPIPTDEEFSSLSAMLMDDNYYNFTLENCDVKEGLMIANELALICLKVKAFLNNRQRKAEGHHLQTNDIEKHKKDVIKLATTLTTATLINFNDLIKGDIVKFIAVLREEQTNIKGIAKDAGLGNITLEDILRQMELVFEIIPQHTVS